MTDISNYLPKMALQRHQRILRKLARLWRRTSGRPQPYDLVEIVNRRLMEKIAARRHAATTELGPSKDFAGGLDPSRASAVGEGPAAELENSCPQFGQVIE